MCVLLHGGLSPASSAVMRCCTHEAPHSAEDWHEQGGWGHVLLPPQISHVTMSFVNTSRRLLVAAASAREAARVGGGRPELCQGVAEGGGERGEGGDVRGR